MMNSIDINLTMLVLVILFVLLMWALSYRNQKKIIEQLQLEFKAQEKLTDTQMQDITEQMLLNAELSEQLQASQDKVSLLEQALAEKKTAFDELQQSKQQLEIRIVELEVAMQKDQQAATEKLALLEDAKNKLGNEFKLLANQIFEEKGKALHEQNIHGLDAVLKPMQEQFKSFRSRIDEIHTDESKERATLKAHLSQLEQLNRQMSEDAVNLTQALKGDSKAQGNWGEMILERILETSGLREGHEFVREDSTTVDVNKRLRPDVIVRMPGDKHIIIDSKVSLTDYERLMGSTDNTERKKHSKAHVQSIKNHIRGLADKHYAHLPGIHSPDYVLMFMPIEGAYMVAIEADQSVFETAFEKGVAVVTPSTLYATLKLIEQLWRAEKQSDNVLKLIERASNLHDKMVLFVESFEEVGSRLKQAQKAYDTSLSRMKDGPGNVLRQIDDMGKLAGKTKKELPQRLIETAMIEQQDEASS